MKGKRLVRVLPASRRQFPTHFCRRDAGSTLRFMGSASMRPQFLDATIHSPNGFKTSPKNYGAGRGAGSNSRSISA
jgi:hypothetical protein